MATTEKKDKSEAKAPVKRLTPAERKAKLLAEVKALEAKEKEQTLNKIRNQEKVLEKAQAALAKAQAKADDAARTLADLRVQYRETESSEPVTETE